MTAPEIDQAAVFQSLPIPMLLLTPDFVMAEMNRAYLQVSGRTREELLGRVVFEAFPDNPSDPAANGVANLTASLRRVLVTAERDVMELQRYDVEVPGKPGQWESRYWLPVNAPVLGPDGRIALIAHCVEEVTDRVRRFIALGIEDD
jgi:PAS domain S-box-containing protein